MKIFDRLKLLINLISPITLLDNIQEDHIDKMTHSIKITSTVVLLIALCAQSFVIPNAPQSYHSNSQLGFSPFNNNNNKVENESATTESKGFNPISEFFDMFSNIDDVIDDFYFKRMGNGEIFYGKRKYKPSGEVDGKYDGFGLSDRSKIDTTREYRAQWQEEKKRRKERGE
mmetsp:Transcript_34921/g.41708  ORF Transcript_34921/g.41708 Transcript_34921/m.41708 type:complete len:172 (-) Transcript_34921:431-946(-)|eukprot:CAMPEP_0198275276 /NCGR_PEP_ID=MMETSP1447-20131203/63910_1 /TAXON_ID=420782 /ORGANISM="Chaetoceros dichaeta, Strain CCMP1751" /LENGTH=171 /DNA_ID=CAMNT_0043969997 /DNA_START=51 /DNA_END=566 /DNA_ORIENTATION=+